MATTLTARGASSASSAAAARASAKSAVAAVLVTALCFLGSAAAAAGEDAGGIYFTLRSVELKLWVDGKSGKLLPPPGGLLLAPRLLSDAGEPEAAAIAYRLTDPARPGQAPALPWLSVDAKTGVLKVTEQRVLGDNGAQRQHVVWLDARGPATLRAPPHRSARPFMVTPERARINVTITLELLPEERSCADKPQVLQPARHDPCHYCHDSCFWRGAELQVWENKRATRLAPVGHHHADVHCGDGHKYTLNNGTEHFELRGPSGGELWSKAQLDRDVLYNASAAGPQRGPGPHVQLSMTCRTSWGSTEHRVLTVHVLDEDDNAPVLEKDEKLEFNFSTESALARGAHILVKDMDSRAVNRFSELQVADPSGVVTHKKLEFDVTHGGVQHTLVSIRLQVKDPMEASYKLRLTLSDLTLVGDNDKKDLRMNVTLWGPPQTPPVAMSSSGTATAPAGTSGTTATSATKDTAGPTTRVRRSEAAPKALAQTSPAVLTATIWEHATMYARVTMVGKPNDNVKYRVADPGGSSWAGITDWGIVYVAKPERLKAGNQTVEVHATGADPAADTVHTLVVTVRPSKPGHPCLTASGAAAAGTAGAAPGLHPDPNNGMSMRLCSQYKTQKQCEANCGLGAGGADSSSSGGCVFRAGDAPKDDVKVVGKYPTCTVHLKTCPDGVCDPLELLNETICMQDCTGRSSGKAGGKTGGRAARARPGAA